MHIIITEQSATEKAFHMELVRFISNNDMRTPSIKVKKNRINSNSTMMLRAATLSCKSGEQALLRGSSLCDPSVDPEFSNYVAPADTSSATLHIAVQTRLAALKDSEAHICSHLKKLTWLITQPDATGDTGRSYLSSFIHRVKVLGDSQTSEIFLEDLEAAKNKTQSSDWKYVKFRLGRRPKNGVISHGKQTEVIFELRECIAELEPLKAELMRRIREYRFMAQVQICQREHLHFDQGLSCSICGNPQLKPAEVSISVGCGHTYCVSCSRTGVCPVEGCNNTNMSYELCPGSLFGVAEADPTKICTYGQKLEDTVSLIRSFRKDEKVLLFLQDDSLLKYCRAILNAHNITNAYLDGKDKDSGKTLENFQGQIQNTKVLILNIASSAAAGW